MNRKLSRPIAVALAFALLSCQHAKPCPDASGALPPGKGTPEEAKAFVEKTNADLKRLWTKAATAEWIKSTYITDDTERNAATVNEEVMGYVAQAIKNSVRFVGLELDADTARMLHLLRVSSALPAPSDAQRRQELAT